MEDVEITEEEYNNWIDESEWVNRINHCPDCTQPLLVKMEQRENGYTEEVAYCSNCGYTESAI